ETGPNAGKPIELYQMRPDRTSIVPGDPRAATVQLIAGYQYKVGAQKVDYEPQEILHQKFFSPLDDFYGLSPIAVAARAVLTDNTARQWNHNLLGNMACPPGAFVAEDELGQESFDR